MPAPPAWPWAQRGLEKRPSLEMRLPQTHPLLLERSLQPAGERTPERTAELVSSHPPSVHAALCLPPERTSRQLCFLGQDPGKAAVNAAAHLSPREKENPPRSSLAAWAPGTTAQKDHEAQAPSQKCSPHSGITVTGTEGSPSPRP